MQQKVHIVYVMPLFILVPKLFPMSVTLLLLKFYFQRHFDLDNMFFNKMHFEILEIIFKGGINSDKSKEN